jgi:hypothetical protein
MHYTMGDEEVSSSHANIKPETQTTLKSTMSGAALKEFLERLLQLLEQAHPA